LLFGGKISLIRFFTTPGNIEEKRIKIGEEDRQHIRSLRIKPSEEFIVCDGAGTDYVCKLCSGGGESVAEILRIEKTQGEPTIDCTIYIAFQKGDRLEYAVQKAVELGAKAIVLFRSKRCIAVTDNVTNKLKRLNKIAHEAAKQSGRGIVPVVINGGNYEEIINRAAIESTLFLFLYEDENTLHLKKVLEQYENDTRDENKQSIAIITGPEGGFDAGEAEAARNNGMQVVSIGPRILRSETAPIVALSALMYHTNNLQRHGHSNEDSSSS
jgi:16S rRNA (uracil1498-N3)-methyltransferase